MARSKTEFVGVIGLGNMGGGIARNLISAGHHVLVWDIADEAMNKFSRKTFLTKPSADITDINEMHKVLLKKITKLDLELK